MQLLCSVYHGPLPDHQEGVSLLRNDIFFLFFLSLFTDQFVEQAISHCSCLAGLDLSFLGDDSYFKLPNDSFIVIQTDLYDLCLPERTISQKKNCLGVDDKWP